MKKNQDVGAIEDAESYYEKMSAALHGRKHSSRAVQILKDFLAVEFFNHLINAGEPLKLGPTGEIGKGLKATKEEMAHTKRTAMRTSLHAAAVVFYALRKRDKEFFQHLIDYCAEKDFGELQQASRVDVLVLNLKHSHEGTWPAVPLTRAELEVYLAKHGQGGIDPKTLAAVVKRTGIQLQKDKRGPRKERRSRSGSGRSDKFGSAG